MPQVHHLNALLQRLQTEAVGLGEEHDSPVARKELIWLIRHRLVRGLIVEFGDLDLSTRLARKETLQMLEINDMRWHNSVGIANVIRAALLKDVPVYSWDPGESELHGGGTPEQRNIVVIDRFLNHFDAVTRNAVTALNAAQGCVFLFGADHFGANAGTLNMLLGDNLHWIELT